MYLFIFKYVLINVNKSLLHPQGGADQRMPIIVSRVAPGTPVSSCISQRSDDVCYVR